MFSEKFSFSRKQSHLKIYGIIMKRIVFPLVLVFLLAAGQCMADNSPMERLKTGIQGIIDILNDPQYKGNPAMKQEMTERVRENIKNFFNFEELSKRSIGRPWLQFTPEERTRFISLFTNLLEQTYLGRIEEYSGEKVAFDKETIIKGKYAQVDTRLKTPKEDIPVYYRLKLVDGEWDVYDVKIEGISLVNNYRTQFSGILDTTTEKTFAKSKDELFKRMNQKLEQLKNKALKADSSQ